MTFSFLFVLVKRKTNLYFSFYNSFQPKWRYFLYFRLYTEYAVSFISRRQLDYNNLDVYTNKTKPGEQSYYFCHSKHHNSGVTDPFKIQGDNKGSIPKMEVITATIQAVHNVLVAHFAQTNNNIHPVY